MSFFSRLFGVKQTQECESALLAAFIWDEISKEDRVCVLKNIELSLALNSYPLSISEIAKDDPPALWGLFANAMQEPNVIIPRKYHLTYIKNPFMLKTYKEHHWALAIEALQHKYKIDTDAKSPASNDLEELSKKDFLKKNEDKTKSDKITELVSSIVDSVYSEYNLALHAGMTTKQATRHALKQQHKHFNLSEFEINNILSHQEPISIVILRVCISVDSTLYSDETQRLVVMNVISGYLKEFDPEEERKFIDFLRYS